MAPKPKPRPAVLPEHEIWFLRSTTLGTFLISDLSNDTDPLRHPDRMKRARNWFLISQAPALRALLWKSILMADVRLENDCEYLLFRDYAMAHLRMTDPVTSELARFVDGNPDQQDLALDLPFDM